MKGITADDLWLFGGGVLFGLIVPDVMRLGQWIGFSLSAWILP